MKPHETDVRELSNLLAIADRDIADAAASELSNDWRFGIAYNAALKLCTMLLYDAGYMPEKNLALENMRDVQRELLPASPSP